MNKQPCALRLADSLTADDFGPLTNEAAAELRRLHEVNQELLEALKELYEDEGFGRCVTETTASLKAKAAIAKATGAQV